MQIKTFKFAHHVWCFDLHISSRLAQIGLWFWHWYIAINLWDKTQLGEEAYDEEGNYYS